MDRRATRVDGLALAAAVFLSGAVLLGVLVSLPWWRALGLLP